MQDKEILNLGILIDLKKKRIRIHRSTLHALGNPVRVYLLVNPEQRMLAVQSAVASDKRAHKVYTTADSNRQTYELYSTSLVNNLLTLNPGWAEPCKYRIQGEAIPSESAVVFKMDDAMPVGS